MLNYFCVLGGSYVDFISSLFSHRFLYRFWSIWGSILESFWEALGVQIDHFWHQICVDFCMSFQQRPKSAQEGPKSGQERRKSGQERLKSGLWPIKALRSQWVRWAVKKTLPLIGPQNGIDKECKGSFPNPPRRLASGRVDHELIPNPT